MKLHTLKIEGFRRHWNTELQLSSATFLIGENNVGKSSILTAIEYLLSDKKKILNEEFFHMCNSESCDVRIADRIVITGEFRNLPEESKNWRGFKGRVFPYVEDNETKYKIYLRKTFDVNKDYAVELKEYSKTIKDEFKGCKTLNEYISNGISEEVISELFGNHDRDKNLTAAYKSKCEEIEDLYEYSSDSETWFRNPGGIPGNLLSKLPRVLIIPAQDKKEDLSGSNGALITTLNELFNDVRDSSNNFTEAQKYLNLLAQELDPNNNDSEFGKMMTELNDVLKDVFPNTGIHTLTKLSDADKVIRPQFTVSMSSNIKTPVELQGTGTVRAAVFALLRYKAIRDNRRNSSGQGSIRPLIIGFEEPELYLHPNAAQQMRETIYTLADSEHNQIICTTHSPYMIDLSQRPQQILNLLTLKTETIDNNINVEIVNSNPFNTSRAFTNLQDDDKSYIKMILKIDDYVAKVFFAKKVLIIEGDTEEVVLRETIDRLSDVQRLSIYQNWQIIKARGKASIISLVKYLKSMGISPLVVHDLDSDTDRAAVFNQPILDAVGDSTKVYALENCIEDVIGCGRSTYDKPYKAYKHIKENWSDINAIPVAWKDVINSIFEFY